MQAQNEIKTTRVLARRLAVEHAYTGAIEDPRTMAPSTISNCPSTPNSPVAHDRHVDDGER